MAPGSWSPFKGRSPSPHPSSTTRCAGRTLRSPRRAWRMAGSGERRSRGEPGQGRGSWTRCGVGPRPRHRCRQPSRTLAPPREGQGQRVRSGNGARIRGAERWAARTGEKEEQDRRRVHSASTLTPPIKRGASPRGGPMRCRSPHLCRSAAFGGCRHEL